MSASTALASPRIGRLVRQSFGSMTRQERAWVMAMYGAIGGLHALGFFIFFVFVLPSHYKGAGDRRLRPGLHPGPAARL